jgi:saccharopine dehydrogenase-like NADP-dependent oxidoreductase
MPDANRALILGCQGGVGRAVQALLERTDPGRRILESLDAVFLADREIPQHPLPLSSGVLLPPTRVTSGEDLATLVREHGITQVIDLASTDTIECARACNSLGAHFLTTSVEEWPRATTMPTDEAIARLLPGQRPILRSTSQLVGSGANPGIVNALAFEALREFAADVGVNPTASALDLYALFITEEDTTAELRRKAQPEVFPMTWSPRHCLEELFESRTFGADRGSIVTLGHRPTARWYEARCGESLIEGMLVPHEEVVTLARRFPSLQIAFVYRMPEAARTALARRPSASVPASWATRRLTPPWTRTLVGEDRLGVLLCSRRYGELWVGYRTDVASGLALGTNATQLQVAAGVIAGWGQLGRRKGIHFVEDLDTQVFVAVASEVLGPPLVVRDETAPVRTLADRSRANPDIVRAPVRRAQSASG